MAAVALAALLASCGGSNVAPNAGRAASKGEVPKPGEVTSNVTFADYAGTDACDTCHSEKVASWRASPMHNMTRELPAAVVKGPWDGTTFRLKDDSAKLETVGGARFMTITSKRYGGGVYRVTRVIGGHYREDYAGILVSEARPDAKAVNGDGELVLPVSYVFATKALRYKGYSVMVKERSGLRAGPVWGETCIFCHNTPPYLSTVLGALSAADPTRKARVQAYQGEVVDPLLPPNKRTDWRVTDNGKLASALETELARLGKKGREPTLGQAIATTRSSFRREHLVEVGIGCEACHLGSAEHVKNPSLRPSFDPKSSFFEARWPSGPEARASRINRVCARCHQVLFSGYEPTWEGGSRHGNAGGSHINSGEARDMLLGGCATKLTCVDCHDPHAADATAKLRAMPPREQDGLCTKCHDKYRTDDALRSHAHHDPSREGARCLACHMPKKNLSLDGSLSRYHRIGSPNDPARVLLDRPLECALCHVDKSVESLASSMESWWKRPFDRGALVKQYGDVNANVIMATATRGKPHEQAVAFHLLGEGGEDGTKTGLSKPAVQGVLATQLTHPYPLVRGYAKRALDRVVGAPVAIDIDAEDAVIEAQAKSLLAP